jgi:hypothetical protein
MIKPPCNFRRTRIFKVHNGILVAIEISLVEKRPGAVEQTRIHERTVIANTLGVKAREKGSG